MNTPAHVAASLCVWRNESGARAASAITLGAFLPDLPMFGFWFYHKVIGTPMRQIWGVEYFRDDWQLFFDVFNSLPLMVLGAIVGWKLKSRIVLLLCASASLHILCDLPVHHDDAHRHFLPLSGFRFASPISYWDPVHYGRTFMLLELTFTVGSCLYLALGWKSNGDRFPRSTRCVASGILALYAAFLTFAIIYWGAQLA